ncbi:MAG: hypothetical protein AB7S68_41970, partial [Polyangiaceae bacterium]
QYDHEAEVQSWLVALRQETDLDLRFLAVLHIGCALHASPDLRQAAVAALLNALEPAALAKRSLEDLEAFGAEAAVGFEQVIPQVRYCASFALGKMGAAARAALPE